MEYKIREIEAKDNKEIENVIRTCLIEFGANHEGTENVCELQNMYCLPEARETGISHKLLDILRI